MLPFLKQDHRKLFDDLARAFNVPFIILQFEAPKALLKERIEHRLLEKKDASDATWEVLDAQLKNKEDLSSKEQEITLKINAQKMVRISTLAKKVIKIINTLRSAS